MNVRFPDFGKYFRLVTRHWIISAATSACLLAILIFLLLPSGGHSLTSQVVHSIARLSGHTSSVSHKVGAHSSTDSESNSSNQGTARGNGAKSGGTTASANMRSGGAIQRNYLPLIASPNPITLGDHGGGPVIVTAKDGSFITEPKLSFGNGLTGEVDEGSPSSSYSRTKWYICIRQIDWRTGGQSYVTITSGNYSTKVVVYWHPVPTFEVSKGALVRTVGTNTITYTASFKIVPGPNLSFYGTPQIHIYLTFAGDCINTSQLNVTVPYASYNNYSISCVVNKAVPYVPGSGPPPPGVGALAFNVNVEAILPTGNAAFGSPHVIGYVSSQNPYNQ